MMDMTVTTDSIQRWLADYVAMLLKVPADSIDVDEQLVYLGVSSSQAMTLTADLEKHLARPIDPALLWEFPTIRRLAQHLGKET
ncbi:acyl carrier protein [Inquilinus sp. Marseille-Q2685]|uniref:acyl carrier protein n=1 Tax=Inquilinus sp. Marseille-Q2685 TaxID=2866581 RepID=UPI001CE451ED|nr:acyl carrier protein [Inquilinus sp. Marseille-Q2685]